MWQYRRIKLKNFSNYSVSSNASGFQFLNEKLYFVLISPKVPISPKMPNIAKIFGQQNFWRYWASPCNKLYSPRLSDRFRLSGTPGVEYMSKYGQHSDEERTKQYFKNVPLNILQALYDKYYWDFKIFGYHPDYAGHPEIDDRL